MTLIARAIPAGAAGWDCDEPVSAASSQQAKAAGKSFVLRYVLGLTKQEVADITGQGHGLVLMSYGRQSDFSAATGSSDAEAMLDHLTSIDVPLGASLTIGLDIETPHDTIANVLLYEHAAAGVIVATKCTSGAYIGAGLGMTSAELYSMSATRYMKSGSRIVDLAGDAAEPQCGYVITQLLPFNQAFAGLTVDFDAAGQDFEGRSWVALYDSAALPAIALSPTAGSVPPPTV